MTLLSGRHRAPRPLTETLDSRGGGGIQPATVQAQVARSGLRKDGERGSRPYVLPAFFLRAPYEAPARESRPSGKPRCRQPGARTFPRASVIPWKPPSTQRTFG